MGLTLLTHNRCQLLLCHAVKSLRIILCRGVQELDAPRRITVNSVQIHPVHEVCGGLDFVNLTWNGGHSQSCTDASDVRCVQAQQERWNGVRDQTYCIRCATIIDRVGGGED